MLQAHSYLWHYLWVAPNLYLLVLAYLMWRRGRRGNYPVFFTFAIVASVGQLILYAADIMPWVSADAFWTVLWCGLLVEALVKFVLIGELFEHIFGPYKSLVKFGKILIRGVGAVLVFIAALVAAFSPVSNPHIIVSGPHLLEQTIYLIESGLLLSIFVLAAYFRLSSDRTSLGICLGLAVSACVHLATWAVAANNSSKEVSVLLDLLHMGAYHVSVLIWSYYLLVPKKAPKKHLDPSTGPSAGPSAGPPHEEDLDVWNRELERLVH
jgi:hypothetical protein